MGHTLFMDSGQRFHELADAAPVLIWRAGPDRAFNYFNIPWLRFTGRTMAQEAGEGWLEGVHPEDRQRCQETLSGAFAAGQEFSLDFRLRRHDGAWRWVLDTGRPFYLEDGAFGGFLGSCVDITDRKEAEVNAARALADARRAIRQRDVLLAEVHHRVKNNLQVILSLLALRGRHLDNDSCRQELDKIGRRIQAIAIVQQELHEDQDVSKIGLKDYLGRVAKPLTVLHRADRVQTEVTGDDLPIDLTTAGIVGMMAAEILSNAYGHAFPEGTGRIAIHVSLDPETGRPRVTFCDDGPGFAGHPSESAQGIGMLLIRNLARQGSIALTIEPGPGARHDLLLPRRAIVGETAGAP
ncbi:MAG: histidine kinase dimerization/phosphoacceptor domain -containing protein [Alsobacter sp.]